MCWTRLSGSKVQIFENGLTAKELSVTIWAADLRCSPQKNLVHSLQVSGSRRKGGRSVVTLSRQQNGSLSIPWDSCPSDFWISHLEVTILWTFWVLEARSISFFLLVLPFPSYPLPHPCAPRLPSCGIQLSHVSHVFFLSLSGWAEEDHDHDLLCYPCDHLSFYHWGHICLKKVSHLQGGAGLLSHTGTSCVLRAFIVWCPTLGGIRCWNQS